MAPVLTEGVVLSAFVVKYKALPFGGNPLGISLKNKIVFVTGASSGIGAATAVEFAKLGARLLICARRMERLKELVPALKDAGAADVFSFELDVRDRNEVEGTLA